MFDWVKYSTWQVLHSKSYVLLSQASRPEPPQGTFCRTQIPQHVLIFRKYNINPDPGGSGNAQNGLVIDIAGNHIATGK